MKYLVLIPLFTLLHLSSDIQFWNKMGSKVDTLGSELEKPAVDRDNRLMYKCIVLLNANNTFLYHDRTIQQLKSAGNYRLIRNKDIADSIVSYDAWIQKTTNDIENIYGHIYVPEMQALENQLFSSKLFGLVKNASAFDSAFQNEPEFVRTGKGKEDALFQFYNKLYNYKSLNQSRIYFLGTLLRRSRNLIDMIGKGYDLKLST